MSGNPLNILIGGEAGQGLVTVGELLTTALVRSGYEVVVTQSYESRIRGGHNTYAVRTSCGPIGAPQESVDILIALDQNTVSIHERELTPRGVVVADEGVGVSWPRSLNVPFQSLAEARFSNTVALGVASFLLGLEEEVIARTITGFFSHKDPQIAEDNRRALSQTLRWCAQRNRTDLKLSPARRPQTSRLVLNGNQAIALGALSAGLRFYSFYPMTPATSVGWVLAGLARDLGLVVEQAEDEISAINMALGASFAGAPSMVATSGGGFALMVEGVSLAGMTETPLVIIIGQRPGPATGLPTRTEQADLEFILHAGHGEFPRAIFAPGSVEQCFSLTREALFQAERYQTPIFVLTDQFLADSSRAVEPFDIDTLSQVEVGSRIEGGGDYRRHAITPDGVSPRLLPGFSEHLVVTDSDEHTEDGHLTEDLAVRKLMVDKRRRKEESIRSEVIPPDYSGPAKPDLLLVCWGSSRGSVLEAAEHLRFTGKTVAVLHFSQVWPLRPDQFLPQLQSAREVVAVEGNASAQMARLIRREADFQISRSVLRYDGLPFTPESILRGLSGHPVARTEGGDGAH
jgi:2-oxoglutarate ferredoxin oxidoreductase subunit alpha